MKRIRKLLSPGHGHHKLQPEEKRSPPEIPWEHKWPNIETRVSISQSVFENIPDEILLQIFRFLSVHELGQLSLVCRHFKMLIDRDDVWQHRVNNSAKALSKSYKQIYMDWMHEKYMRNAELEEVEDSYIRDMSSVACGMRMPPPRYPLREASIPDFQTVTGFLNHPNSSKDMIIDVTVDLEKTARELLSLLKKASSFQEEWRKPTIVKQMILRYYRFMKLKASQSKNILLIPTLDIEIIWQTHILRPSAYRDDCIRLFHRVIDHSLLLNDIEQSIKEQAFLDTCRLYEENYGESYCTPIAPNQDVKKTPRFVHHPFSKLKCLIPVYSYWDTTHMKFSHKPKVEREDNPFSFTEADVILDGNWLALCDKFLMESIHGLSSSGSTRLSMRNIATDNLTRCDFNRLKKSYERFLYMVAKYPPADGYDYVHPTYAIDIIWHAHMQEPNKYSGDCQRLVGHLVDHAPWPSVNPTESKLSCKSMDQIWEREFKVKMSVDHLYDTLENIYERYDD